MSFQKLFRNLLLALPLVSQYIAFMVNPDTYAIELEAFLKHHSKGAAGFESFCIHHEQLESWAAAECKKLIIKLLPCGYAVELYPFYRIIPHLHLVHYLAS